MPEVTASFLFQLFGGLVFGVFGFYFFKQAKARANFVWLFIGLTLMIFPYFVTNPWLEWAIGLGLLTLGYFSRVS